MFLFTGSLEVSPFLSQGSGLSIQGSSIWPCDKTLCFHPFDGGHSNISTEKGSCTVSIFGRMVGQKSGSSRNSERPTVYNRTDYVPRTDNQRRKVRFGSVSELCVHRNGILNTQEHSSSAIRQSTGHSGTVTVVQETETGLSKSLSVSSGKTKCCSSICSIGQATLTSTSNGSVCTMETSCASLRGSHSSQCSYQEAFGMVGQQGTFHLGCNTETVSTNTQSFHGCEPLRMGSPSRTGRTAVSWSLNSRPISSSYQCFRDESNIASSKTMSPICLQFSSDDCHRQLFGSFVSDERRGHPFSISVHGGMGDTPVVQSERNKSSGETYTRKIEHFSRLVKSSFPTNFDRMVSGSDDLQLDSVDDGLSKHRSVCDSSQQEVTNLCVSYPRRKGSGDRCNVNELERNARLCVSSVCSDSSSNQQDSPTSLQHSVDSSSLGRNVLVSGHSSVSSSTGHSDFLAQKSVDTIGSEICQGKRRKLKTSRLEFIRRLIRDRKFSANVARHAAEARRSSTRRVYDAKWKVFSDWCLQR